MKIIESSSESGACQADPARFVVSPDLIQKAPIGIFHSTPEGRLLAVNPCMAHMHGFESPAEMISTITDIGRQMYVDSEDRRHFEHVLENQVQLTDYESRQWRRDGSILWTSESIRAVKDDTGRILYYEGFATDITDRKKAQKELETSNSLLQSILKAVPDLLMVIDKNFTIRYSNFKGHDLIHPDAAAVDDHTCYGRFKLLNSPCEDCSAVPVFQTGCAVEREMINPTDGRTREVRVFPLYDADGQVPMVIEYVRDISDLKLAQEENRKCQRFVELVLYHAPYAILTLDSMHRVIDWNPGAVKMFGYTPGEAVGKNLDDLVAQNDMYQEASTKTRDVLSGQRIEAFETIRYRKDGTAIHVIASGSPIMIDNRLIGIVALYTDITARKQDEEALQRRAEELTALNTLGRSVGSTLSIQQICDVGLRGMLNAVNADMAFLFLHKGNRLILQDVLPVSARERLGEIPDHRVGECMCGLAVTENKPLYSLDVFEDPRCTWEECKRSGIRSFAALPLRTASETIGVIGLASDSKRDFEKQSGFLETLSSQISVSLANAFLFQEVKQELIERKRVEAALRFERERFQVLIQQSPFGMLLIEKSGRFMYANPMFTEILGYTLEDVPDGRTWFKLAFPDPTYRKQVISFWMKDIKTTIPGQNPPRVFDVICKNEGKKIIRFIGVMLETGEHIIVCEDITERLMLEDQLQHAQKMEAVGILAGGVAHDFNNLLQAISGYTQLLLMDKHEGDPEHSKLKAIENSVDRAARLVRQLLLYSRKVDSEHRNVNLNQEVVQAIKMMERTIPRMIEIEFYPDIRLWKVKADPVQIEQTLLNLGINAADAMPDGGKIIIQTRNITIDAAYARNHVNIAPGKYVLMTLSDTGVGIDKETQKHIFEPFFTTKGIGKGTGLGLASVYGIVRGHRGAIQCDSAPGHGTAFRIYLPAIEQADAEVNEPNLEIQPDRGAEAILIVDDEADIRDLTSQMLQRFGYRVLTAKNGEEALYIHACRKHDISLTILDLGMPGMGGYRCLQELLAVKPSTRILIASGYYDDVSVKQALESGATGFIGKPYQLKEMLTRIRNILDGK